MNRTGLVIALAVAAVVGVIFGLRPDLDLKLAGLFFDPNAGDSGAPMIRRICGRATPPPG